MCATAWSGARAERPRMPRHCLLLQPSVNRVYAGQAIAIGTAELRTLSQLLLDDRVGDISTVTRGGVPFLDFDTAEPLTATDLDILANLSVAYVLFEDRDGLLAPVDRTPLACFDDDLLTTLRYVGKTNEQFTKLLVNLAAAAADPTGEALAGRHPLRLLDPLCGRGTTLNQALMYGLDAYGIELDPKEVDAYETFLKTWLEGHRVKHRTEHLHLRKGRDTPARRLTVTITRTVADEKVTQVLVLVNDDTTRARDHLKRSSVDLVVGDLPYGIQHAARSDEWGRSRRATTMLADALPVWRTLLRPGGSLCLAWNLRQIPRDELRALVTDAGFALVAAVDDDRFAHRVDRTIQRDLVLAIKPH